MAADGRDSSGVWFPPPLIMLLSFGVGWGIDRFLSEPIAEESHRAIVRALAVVLALFAAGLAASALATFRKAGTSAVPIRPSTALAERGPYRFTRNPMYIALVVGALALGLLGNSWWEVASAVPTALILNFAVISREERYLAAKFGESYRGYKARVRRWL